MTTGVIAEFQGEAALEGLAIGDARLRLDSCAPRLRVTSADLRVPRPEVALERERYLGSPAERWMEPRPQSLEERQLCPIPDRIPGGVGADREVQPKDGAIRTEEAEIRILNVTALKSTDPRVRRADCPPHVSLAQAGSNPGKPSVVRHPTHGIPTATSSTIRGSFSTDHQRPSCHEGLHWQSTKDHRSPSVPNGDRDAESPPSRPLPSPVGTLGDRAVGGADRTTPLAGVRSLVGTLGVHGAKGPRRRRRP